LQGHPVIAVMPTEKLQQLHDQLSPLIELSGF
jgi:hypothetical protein